jgi:LuxR family maltose regulon positive regulatory protein
LTATEVLILKYVDSGKSPVQVARQIQRSEHTVRTHLRNAYAKLGAHGRDDALTRARALGMLDR